MKTYDVMNFYHPDTELFTREYGWMPMHSIYEATKANKTLNICNFDGETSRFFYEENNEILSAKVRSCTYHFGNYIGSGVRFNVHPNCEVLVSLDKGETFEYVTAKEIHDVQQEGYQVYFTNLETFYDLRKGKRPRLTDECTKENYTFNNGIVYGIVNSMGSVLTKYKGRYTVLGCYTK